MRLGECWAVNEHRVWCGDPRSTPVGDAPALAYLDPPRVPGVHARWRESVDLPPASFDEVLDAAVALAARAPLVLAETGSASGGRLLDSAGRAGLRLDGWWDLGRGLALAGFCAERRRWPDWTEAAADDPVVLAVDRLTEPGDVVLDPHAGFTGLHWVAKASDRRFVGSVLWPEGAARLLEKLARAGAGEPRLLAKEETSA